MTRRCGLTVDNLLSADVVLADGSFVTASADAHPDLFWALRGGGGNFGVVTSFEFRCHDVGMVTAGPVLYDIADTTDVLRWYREVQPGLPEELNGWFAVLTIPPAPPFPEALWLRKACGIVWCYSGPAERAEQALAPVRGFGSPLLDAVQPMPYPVLQSIFDALYPPGLQWYWRADFFNEIPDAAVAVHRSSARRCPRPLHDASVSDRRCRAPRRHRRDRVRLPRLRLDRGHGRRGSRPGQRRRAQGLGGGVLGGAASHLRRWRLRELHDGRGADRVRASYGPNYDRLARIKASYDPQNFFRVNQNIPPAS